MKPIMVIIQGNPSASYIAPPPTGPTMDPRPCAQFIIPAIIPYVCRLFLSYPVALENSRGQINMHANMQMKCNRFNNLEECLKTIGQFFRFSIPILFYKVNWFVN